MSSLQLSRVRLGSAPPALRVVARRSPCAPPPCTCTALPSRAASLAHFPPIRRHSSFRTQAAATTSEAEVTADGSSTRAGSTVDAGPDKEPVPEELKPGRLDDQNFVQGPSVQIWRDFRFPRPGDPEDAPLQNLSKELQALAGNVGDARAAAYWGYHLLRSSFFVAQGAVGVLAQSAAKGSLDLPFGRRTTTAGEDTGALKSLSTSVGTAARLFAEALQTYKADYAFIQEGLYKLPYDMNPQHRQFSPLFVAGKSMEFVRDAMATLSKRDRGAPTSVWLGGRSNIYPEYYLHTFHYQNEGWFSPESASVYETSTETLFVGRQDAMQRHTLVPLGRFMQGKDPAQMQVLEVGCGTGRFHTYLRDSYPELSTVAADLSPFYLHEARRNMEYWEGLRGAGAAGSTQFVQANAEAVPFGPAAFDAVLSVYMFHEMPAEAHRKVVAEVARVLKPGGLFVLTDSVQLGDRPAQDPYIGRFSDFAEPHYANYIETDFAALCREVGLEPHEKELASASKVLSFIKREPAFEATPASTTAETPESSQVYTAEDLQAPPSFS